MKSEFSFRNFVRRICIKLFSLLNSHNIAILTGFVVLSCAKIMSSAQFISLGPCPRVYGMPNFNTTGYEGRWYEVEKYWFVFEATSSCVSVEYLDKGDGTFAVEISQIEGLSGRKMMNPGLTRYLSRDGSADFVLDLLVTQSPVPFRFQYPYIVIDTDYISYTVKYRCMQAGPFNLQTMWILSRNRTLASDARKAVYTKLRKIGLDTTRLTISDQGNCPPP